MNAFEIYDIGYNYYTGGNGYPLNYSKAFECFSKSADGGVSDAMNGLGVMYQNGYGVPANIQTALYWFDKAVQTDDNPFASYNIAAMYYDGILVPKDINKAYSYFLKSFSIGPRCSNYAQSSFFIGMILTNNFGNYREAFRYFSETVKYENNPEAWHNLGYLCEKGAMNIPKGQIPSTACKYYLKAAELGNAMSMDAAGRMYYVMGDMGEARHWIQKAASMGYKPAKNRLKMMNFSQSGSFWDLLR